MTEQPDDVVIDAQAEPEAAAVAETEAPAQEPSEAETQARALGWKPKAEWKGDATNWADADTFLSYHQSAPAKVKRLEAETERLRKEYSDRLARMERMAAEAEKRRAAQYEADLAAVRAQRAAAERAQDFDAFRDATAREVALQRAAPVDAPAPAPAQAAPDVAPEVAEWGAKNDWITSDPGLLEAAKAYSREAEAKGFTDLKANLAYVDGKMARFRPVQAAPGRTAAAVDSGGLAAGRKPGKGWADIPAADRALAQRDIDGKIFKDQAEYAAAYWSQA